MSVTRRRRLTAKLGRALYAPLFDSPEQPADAARNPYDKVLHDFLGELEISYEVMEITVRGTPRSSP